MKRTKRLWLAALALSLLLTCAACGEQKTPADTTPDTQQEQTVTDAKDSTAKTEDKSETKADAKTEDKTETKADTKTEELKKTEEAKKAEETKKQETARKTEETTTKTEETKQQETSKTQQSEQVIDPSTGKDKYQTDPVPEGKPVPVEPEDTTVDTGTSHTCTFSITCETILDNWDAWDEWDKEVADAKKPLVPSDGVILPATTVSFSEGESVFDVLQRVCRENGIHMESNWTPMYNSAYVEGINNLYEFNVSQGSGWMYEVNGWFPNYGCSRYQLEDGDVVHWCYTCDLGYDVGGGYMAG